MVCKKRGAAWIRVAAMILVVAMVLPVGVSAAVQPRASQYLYSCDAEVYDVGGGKVQAWFWVFGMGPQELLGVSTIKLYESADGVNWTWVKSYGFVNYPSMLKTNAAYHSGHMDYQGESGMYYKAYVTFFGGTNDAGDTRYYWTTATRVS